MSASRRATTMPITAVLWRNSRKLSDGLRATSSARNQMWRRAGGARAALTVLVGVVVSGGVFDRIEAPPIVSIAAAEYGVPFDEISG